MTKKKTTLTPRLEAVTRDMCDILHKAYEAGVMDGIEFANMSWIHRLKEVDNPEAFFNLLKEQGR